MLLPTLILLRSRYEIERTPPESRPYRSPLDMHETKANRGSTKEESSGSAWVALESYDCDLECDTAVDVPTCH